MKFTVRTDHAEELCNKAYEIAQLRAVNDRYENAEYGIAIDVDKQQRASLIIYACEPKSISPAWVEVAWVNNSVLMGWSQGSHPDIFAKNKWERRLLNLYAQIQQEEYSKRTICEDGLLKYTINRCPADWEEVAEQEIQQAISQLKLENRFTVETLKPFVEQAFVIVCEKAEVHPYGVAGEIRLSAEEGFLHIRANIEFSCFAEDTDLKALAKTFNQSAKLGLIIDGLEIGDACFADLRLKYV